MKKLFCFDIDGTLRTTTDHQIPGSTIKALNLLREKGHLLLVSTGRSVDSLKNTHIMILLPLMGMYAIVDKLY